ncbi:MAG: zinc ABC transporter substrate-binding protein [Verrucomicrobia bacterium]|nr:zinc ABC transporter substrate-binding protein [Verrucomicrobiota bacterium]
MYHKALFVLTLIFAPCMASAGTSKIEVVCSFSILEDWCHQILKDKGLIHSLVPIKGELHEYQLSAQDVVRLKRSQVVVGFSPDSEAWLHDWAKSSPNHRVLWLGVNEDGTRLPSHGWTDPLLVMSMVTRLCAELNKTDPNLNVSHVQMLKEAQSVDSELKALFSTLPAERRKLVTQHPSLNPFAARYGIKIVGTLLESSSGEAADTSARHFSRLLKSIRADGVRVIVTDEGHNQEMAKRLASDAGIPSPIALNFESLPSAQGSSWKSMMVLQGRMLHEALMLR